MSSHLIPPISEWQQLSTYPESCFTSPSPLPFLGVQQLAQCAAMTSAVDMESNPFIIDHNSQDGDHHDKPPLSDSDSDVDESALHRDYFEKDDRFLDEPALEEGVGLNGDESQGYSYPPTSKRTRTRQPKLFIFILLCILLAAAAIGILAGHGFAPASTTYSRKGGSKHLTMDHIFNGTFQPHLENIAWVKEGEFAFN
jgi:hypothetical protein